MNKRYQKDAKVGSTRKSASSAKPKRSSASPVSSSPAKKKSSRGSGYQSVVLPPEIRRLQKLSFALLGVAVVISLLYLWQGNTLGTAGGILLGVAYACMFTALYIDFARVRPVIKAIRRGEVPSGKPGAKAAPVADEQDDAAAGTGWLKRLTKSKPAASDDETPGDEGT